MLKKEQKYDFRKRMLEIHKPNIINRELTPNDDEFVIENGVVISLPENAGIVVETAAKDLREYLDISMNVSSIITKDNGIDGFCHINVCYAKDAGIDLGDVAGYMGYKIEIGDTIEIYGFDERGIAQAFYKLEELMSLRKAPFIKKGEIKNKAMFSPRMVHSGYRMDEFPDEHLSAIAHAGMDAILVFVKDVDVTPYGFLGFNELIHRAEKFGIDAYVYSYLKCKKHHEDADAEEYFDALYGKIFKACPKFKGIILVGESCEFPSKDPNTSGALRRDEDADKDPTVNLHSKPYPGYWPSADYPGWLNMVKKSIRKYTPDADIVFWTYNWGYAPEEDRLKLIENLPTDISLLVTFEMFHKYKLEKATAYTADYTIAFEGPGNCFVSEAKAAKARGIRLYTMANTAGRTWDMGTVPYWPTPYQWIKRYKKLIEARDNWGLCGIMESHHYGIYPSFISQLTKAAYSDFNKPIEEELRDIIKINFTDNDAEVDTILEALGKWSEAITYHSTSNEDQAGPNRIGTAYHLCLTQTAYKPEAPAHATAKSGWYSVPYNSIDRGRCSIFPIRIHEELKRARKMHALFEEGVKILETIKNPCEELERLINLGKFITRNEQTIINTKEWNILRNKIEVETDAKLLDKYLDEIEKIAYAEIENAKESIPLLEVDSSLGWEPSMEYIGSVDRVEWKIKFILYTLYKEVKWYKDALKYDL